VSWEESIEALALLLGTRRGPAETHTEFAHRVGPQLGDQATLLIDLAHDVDAAMYAPEQIDDDAVRRAADTSSAVVALVHAHVSRNRQWKDRLDVRPLLPHLRPSTRRRAGTRD